ncbi:MAG: glycosyltransferase family 4 protein [Planctomycetes bacterium]|nr:glycosyltransferase family 4 protein [Planctomycetota bacterium]
MNICHVITRLIIGGAQENTVLTCRGLAERGHQVTLISGPETGPEGSLWEQARASGAELITVESLRRAVNPWLDWQTRCSLRHLFDRIQPDVVHTHSSKAGILGRSVAADAGVPVIVHTIHGMSFNRTQSRVVRTLYQGLEQWAGRHTTAFVSVSDAMIDQAVEARLAPRQRFTTIRSGIETDRFTPQPELRDRYRREWGIGNDEIVVGTIARLFANKGYESIMRAMGPALARHPKLRFVWIGDGAYRRRYERRLALMGLGKYVHFVGLVPPSAVPCLLNGFDILLHASAWEGLPRAVVQGLLMEVPAVSFDNDGAPEVVIPGETGLLVPYGDTGRLAGAIVELACDPDRRRAMGRQGRRRCLEMFDWRDMVSRIEMLYEQCLGSSRP